MHVRPHAAVAPERVPAELEHVTGCRVERHRAHICDDSVRACDRSHALDNVRTHDRGSVAFVIPGVLFLATLIRLAFGFGEALIAVPLLALVLPVGGVAPAAVLASVTVAFIHRAGLAEGSLPQCRHAGHSDTCWASLWV
jgi:hypothetical protein